MSANSLNSNFGSNNCTHAWSRASMAMATLNMILDAFTNRL